MLAAVYCVLARVEMCPGGEQIRRHDVLSLAPRATASAFALQCTTTVVPLLLSFLHASIGRKHTLPLYVNDQDDLFIAQY